jgi:hypothetical protein
MCVRCEELVWPLSLALTLEVCKPNGLPPQITIHTHHCATPSSCIPSHCAFSPCLSCRSCCLNQDLVLAVDGSVNAKVYITGYAQVGPARPSYPQHYGYPMFHDVSGE